MRSLNEYLFFRVIDPEGWATDHYQYRYAEARLEATPSAVLYGLTQGDFGIWELP